MTQPDIIDAHHTRLPGGITAIRADNPGPMTLTGTNTWVIRPADGPAVVIDPGPRDSAHLARIARVAGPDVSAVILSHTHIDHSEAAPEYARSVGAPLLTRGHGITGSRHLPTGPLELAAIMIEVLPTPGHTGDSVSIAVGEYLLTGDTVLGMGTTVVAHPDGRLADYLASLHLLSQWVATRGTTHLLPGHGPVLSEPTAALAGYLAHRQERLAAVADAAAGRLAETNDSLAADVVAAVYQDVPRHLWPAATLSVCAQLDFLRETARD